MPALVPQTAAASPHNGLDIVKAFLDKDLPLLKRQFRAIRCGTATPSATAQLPRQENPAKPGPNQALPQMLSNALRWQTREGAAVARPL